MQNFDFVVDRKYFIIHFSFCVQICFGLDSTFVSFLQCFNIKCHTESYLLYSYPSPQHPQAISIINFFATQKLKQQN